MKFSHVSAMMVVATGATVYAAPAPAVNQRRGTDDPVCIIGAGPAGLTAAASLKKAGKGAIIFEKQTTVGGKCQSYYEEEGSKQYHPLGALLFSNGTYPHTLDIVTAMGTDYVPISPQRGANKDWDYDYKNPNGGVVPAKMSLNWFEQGVLDLEVSRYNQIWHKKWEKYAVVGFKNGIPKEFQVSTADWMSSNLFFALRTMVIKGMFMYGYGDLREIPIAYVLQYFTPDIMLFFSNKHTGYLIDYHAMWKTFSETTLADTPIHLGAEVHRIDRSSGYPEISYSDSTKTSRQQSCSAVILAFPPTISNLQSAGLTVSKEEQSLFSKVVVENYYSGAIRVKTPDETAFTAKQNAWNLPPDAAGEPVLSIRLFKGNDIATVYSWDSKPGNFENLEEAKQFTMKCLSSFNKDPQDKRATTTAVTNDDVKAFRKNDYFPHVSTTDVGTFYDGLHKIQGQDRTYYASGLNMFEMVEFAVMAGRDIVDNYLLKA